MTDPDYQARIDALAKELADMRTGLLPAASQTATLTSAVVTMRSELSGVATQLADGILRRAIHKSLDQPEEEISANFFLSAEPPPTTDTSFQWLTPAALVCSPSGVLPVTYVKSQPGSQIRPCFSTTPVRQVNERPLYYHVDGDFAARARAQKDKSIGRDYDRTVVMADWLERLIQGFEILVRMPALPDEYRRHALSYMKFGQLIAHHEYMRLDHLMLLTDDPTNRRALQFSASVSSTGAGIADRFITRTIAEAYRKAGLTALPQQFKKDKTQNSNPATQQPHDKRHKDAGTS